MEENLHKEFLRRAIACAYKGKETQGGVGFGAVIVKDTLLIAAGPNRVGVPTVCTQHAELARIQQAGKPLSSKCLSGCSHTRKSHAVFNLKQVLR
ncbi:deaminase [Leeuwenhoekiella aestuarii]|uniref:Cytidine/deoxycytidylate deaminase-like protein n=1 Tax=Leeuwenhoekiella aestuarii TaxID=2249426 RepID=A0A4Q0NU85_9FLAO|nr:deaminase [Leeuwenhoekiella aestuarii]RXG15251.1 cytidine/deoxycytidylate deaminase-like protein [Leeuwenhoekiella aestuarii]